MKKNKFLIIGAIAVVVVLAAVLALVLTRCGSAPAAVTVPTTETVAEVETYTLYWNMDRALYGGKSEAGMSSRQTESDGYFYIRFFVDGQEVTLRAVDRKVVNAVDHEDVMGLEVDEDGIVTGVYRLDEMPVQRVGWRFYVQSAARTTIKLNSSEDFNAMEVLLEDLDANRIWDMSGKSGPVGCVTEAIKYDRVMAIADMDGYVTHVFIYERPNYMLTHEAECQQCGETVTWNEWTRTDAIPKDSGHYQLQNDVTLKSQASLQEDAKVCLDLNGCRIEGKKNNRVIIMNKPSIELAIMDTSEEQTGAIVASGVGNMGMGIMVKYGALTLRGGTIDASAVQNTSGGAVSVSKGQFFYMYGGKIVGGEAKCVQNATTGAYESGAGGAVYVSGKFVMHDGIIENGKATSIVSYKNGSRVYNRGLGGNVYLASTAEFEMHGGTIKGGQAGSYGGNIASDGTATLLITGGSITGGTVTGDGRMGGNIYTSSKVKCTIQGGSITGGKTWGHSGNLYSSGTLTISGGTISGGVAYDAATGKLKDTATHHNIFVVNGTARISGGTIKGGIAITDSSATDAKTATLYLSGSPRITDGPNGFDLTISNERVVVNVGSMGGGAKVGINAKHGIFTKPTSESNTDKFFSNIDQAEVIYFDGCLGVGRVGCLCGKEAHALGCDGTVLFWMPHGTGNSLPVSNGNYYLTRDVVTSKGYVVSAGHDVKLDFNGYDVTYQVPGTASSGFRLYRSDNNSKMTLTDTTDAPGTFKTLMPAAGTKYTGKPLQKGEEDGKPVYFEAGSAEEQAEAERLWAQGDYGSLLWARGGEINILAGIFDGTAITGSREQGGMVFYVARSTSTDATTGESVTYPATMNIYGGTIKGGDITAPGNIAVKEGAVLNMYGGTIVGGKANSGGALYVSGTANIEGGTIEGGTAVNAEGVPVNGGNIYVSLTGTLNMLGGTVSGGKADIGGNIYAYGTANVTGGIVEKGEASKCGGNIGTNAPKSVITLAGDAIIRDGYGLRGGNVALYVRGNLGFTLAENVQILNGEGKESGGNIFVATWLDEPGDLQMNGGTVSGGKAPTGGNVYVGGSTSGCNATFTAMDGTIESGNCTDGANIAIGHGSAAAVLNGVTVHNTTASASNILVECGKLTVAEGTVISNEATNASNIRTSTANDTVSQIFMTGGTIQGGTNSNVRVMYRDSFEMSGGLVTGGSAARGGNIYAEGSGGAYATVTLKGGTVEKGTSTDPQAGANIRLNNGSSHLVLDGATVPGGIHANSTSTVTLKGDVTVDKGESGYAYSIRMGASARLILDELTGGAVYVTSAIGNTVAENVASDELLAFVLSEVLSGEEIVPLKWNEESKTLFMGKDPTLYCTCGATKDDGYTCHCAEADKGEQKWVAWESADSLPTASGNYYLKNNVDLTTATVVKPEANATIRIDLRGKQILLENSENLYNFTEVSGVRLVITDSAAQPGSVILTGTDNVTGGIMKLSAGNTFGLYRATMDVSGFQVGALDGGLAYISSNSTFEVYSGNLVGNSAGRTLYVNGNANLYGGTMSGALVNIRIANAAAKVKLEGITINSTVANGTSVRVDSGELTIARGTTLTNTANNAANVVTTNSGVSHIIMTGGTIQGGTNSNLRILNGDTLTVSGGIITGGTAANGGNIYVEGKDGAESTVIVTGGTIENGTSENGANICLANGYSHLVVNGATIPGGVLAKGGATVTLKGEATIDKGESAAYSVKLEGGSKLVVSEMTGGKVYVTADVGATVAENVTAATEFVLSDSAAKEIVWREATNTLVVEAFGTYCTCGAGKTASYDCHCAEGDKGDVTWQAWEGTTALPTAGGNYYLTNNVDLTADTVAKPEANATIRIDLRGKTITLENEENLYNLAEVTGVRLVLTDSALQPGSVVISGTATTLGGMLDITAGNTVAVYRVTLDATGLNASSKGGSIANVNSGASFLLCSGNVLGKSGSMIYVKGQADLLGGTVTGASIKVRLDDDNAKVTLAGVTITNDVASATSVRVDKGLLTIAEGTTITNTATGSANVATMNSGVSRVVMTGGIISGATNSNVRVMNGDTFEMSGGSIINGASNRGGNIYVEGTTGAEAWVTITGGTISGGTTTESRTGANIRLNNGASHLVLENVSIPGGIHANSTATVTLRGNVTVDKGNSGCDYSLRMGSSAKLLVKDMVGGAVYVYADSDGKVIAEDAATDLSSFFFSDRNTFTVAYSDGKLVYKAK